MQHRKLLTRLKMHKNRISITLNYCIIGINDKYQMFSTLIYCIFNIRIIALAKHNKKVVRL